MTAEAVLRDSEAERMRKQILQVVQNSKFDRTESISAGNWNVGALIYVGEETATVYFTDSQIALGHGGKLTYYTIRENASDDFNVLVGQIQNLLKKSES